MEERKYYIRSNFSVYTIPSLLLIKGSHLLEVKYYITT
jgi:hypothetical protein